MRWLQDNLCTSTVSAARLSPHGEPPVLRILHMERPRAQLHEASLLQTAKLLSPQHRLDSRRGDVRAGCAKPGCRLQLALRMSAVEALGVPGRGPR